MQALLIRQWRRFFGSETPPERMQPFLSAVSDAYVELDTARRLVERALELSSGELHSSNSELRGVLQVLPDLLFRVSAMGDVTGVMQGSTVTSHPALRSIAAPSSPVAELFERSVARVRETRTAVAFEYEHQTERGPVTYEVRLLPFVDADIIGVARDISDRKQGEHDRLILGKLESTGVLAGGIAHDFNNLLTSILLNVDMALAEDARSEDVVESLATIRSGVLASQVLTQQLITFARGGSAVRQPVVLSELLRESVPLALSGSNVLAEVVIDDALWPTDVDSGQIGQVIRNFVINAREAMPDGGVVSLEASNVELGAGNSMALPHGRYVRIAVADNGLGIAAEVLPQIFDPYYSTKMRGPQKGMGLGLTICHSVVTKHGGGIIIDSVLGAGATFTVFLPACDVTSATSGASSSRARSSGARGRILVMDDEPMVLRAFEGVLAQLGYEATLAPDGRVAIEAYANAMSAGRRYDAVILDLTVKGQMGGKEAARELLAADPTVHAIVMSGYGEDDVMRDPERFGFRGRLTKPFDRNAVRDVLAIATRR